MFPFFRRQLRPSVHPPDDFVSLQAAMGDFDRFKAMVAKKEVNAKARKAVA